MGSHSPSAFLKKASDIASFYGFRPVHSLAEMLPRAERPSVKAARTFDGVANTCVQCLAGRAQDALLCFHASPTVGEDVPGLGGRDLAEFGISIIGSQGPIGEIVALKTMLAILNDINLGVRSVRLGGAGDRDSQARFARELSIFFRKRAGDLCDACKDKITGDPLSILNCTEESCAKIAHEAPRATTFLSEKSRSHLRGVLEYLERIDMPYEIDEHLVYDSYLPKLIFSLVFEGEEDAGDSRFIAAARGGRYDDYVRKLTGKKEASAVRASIYFKRNGVSKSALTIQGKERRAKIYFIRLGVEASLKGLFVMDTLRKARIPVYQSFASDKLAPQLSEAERLKVPYIIIMGQREALQDAVIVRKVETRSQHIVRVAELPRFLTEV